MWSVLDCWLVCRPVWCQMSVRSCSQLLARNTKSIQSLCHPLSACDGVLISNMAAINLTNQPGSTPRGRTVVGAAEVDVYMSGKAVRFGRRRDGCWVGLWSWNRCESMCVCVWFCPLNKQRIRQTCTESPKAKTPLPAEGTKQGGGAALRSDFKIASNV